MSVAELGPYVVRCGVCKATFPSGYGATQAPHCAAHLAEGVVYGHYGSAHDLTKLAWTAPEPAPADVDPVCDSCIDCWIAQGKLAPAGVYLDFDDGDGGA